MMVGRLLSYWEGNFSGAMLNFGRVTKNSGFSQPFCINTWRWRPLDLWSSSCRATPCPWGQRRPAVVGVKSTSILDEGGGRMRGGKKMEVVWKIAVLNVLKVGMEILRPKRFFFKPQSDMLQRPVPGPTTSPLKKITNKTKPMEIQQKEDPILQVHQIISLPRFVWTFFFRDLPRGAWRLVKSPQGDPTHLVTQ